MKLETQLCSSWNYTPHSGRLELGTRSQKTSALNSGAAMSKLCNPGVSVNLVHKISSLKNEEGGHGSLSSLQILQSIGFTYITFAGVEGVLG